MILYYRTATTRLCTGSQLYLESPLGPVSAVFVVLSDTLAMAGARVSSPLS